MELSATELLLAFACNSTNIAIIWIWDVYETNQVCKCRLRIAFEQINCSLTIISFLICLPGHADIRAEFAILVLHDLGATCDMLVLAVNVLGHQHLARTEAKCGHSIFTNLI